MVERLHQLLLLLVQPARVVKQRLLLLLVQPADVDKQLQVVDKQQQLVLRQQVHFLLTTLIRLLQVDRTANIVIVFVMLEHIVTEPTDLCIETRHTGDGVDTEG